MGQSDTTSSPPAGHGGLKREVGLAGLLWASVGAIIGSGWLFGAQKAAVAAGPAALLSWGIGAVAIVLLALVHAELGGLFPVAGGTARYPHYAFGGFAGMSFGWFTWLQAATIAPIEVQAMINYAQHWSWADGFLNKDLTLTATGFVVAAVLMGVFVAINFLGVRLLAHTNSAATVWKVAIPVLTIFALGITGFNGSNFTVHGFAPDGAKGVLAAISSSGVIFALLGFEQAIQWAGESRNPRKDIPRAVIGSVVIGTIIYVMLQVVFIGALPPETVAGGWTKLTYPGVSGPFAGLATLIGLGWLATILFIDAVVSPAGTGLVYITSSSRVTYGLSRNGYAPRALQYTDRNSVPWLGLLIAWIAGVICFLPFPSWQRLVGFITSAVVLMYAGAPLAFGVLRKRLPGMERSYNLPGGTVVSPIAFVVASLVIYWAGWDTLWRLGLAIVIGYLLLGGYSAYAASKGVPNAPRMDFRAGQWLPVYLIGMGIVSWQGSFGVGAQGNLPLWWDIGVVVVFSLVVYYWALSVALPAEDIERNIRGVEVVDAGGH
ncbi:APC family permease [Kitasatospora aureofaciens]|uniref:Amino acid permease n=1 Tax=Kitasatospora aureofaciens TaxID=1894 RepID=A0A8H9HRK5_KITAU|nr:APC family permease [Kitasatospora aureofaciens]ARF78217.1 amino acid permease [Kitasatospora aureofaciens]QEU99433.1 APC family permease [Streptomyces viridifaciens]UKZ05517.1 APC family permease [Streptomyces viridifaciens]GGU80875.1 amino acid permease [Kitasatospora aureofaciens]